MDYTYPSSNTTHQGYIGFLTQVANNIINLGKTDEMVEQLIRPNSEHWEAFIDKFLNHENEQMERKLGNHDPRQPNITKVIVEPYIIDPPEISSELMRGLQAKAE